jgi:hypothetical protein
VHDNGNVNVGEHVLVDANAYNFYSRQICIFEHVDLDVHVLVDVAVDGCCLIRR